MKNRTGIIVGVVVLIIIIAAFIWSSVSRQSVHETNSPSAITVSYMCDSAKNITATLYNGPTIPSTSSTTPPIPGGKAHVVLSDGRTMDLAQTLSADGVRYANSDESFVFWSKGNGALVLENNQQKSYIGCVLVKPDSGNLSEVYHTKGGSFSMRYPSGWVVDPSYVNTSEGEGKDIYGVKFSIPKNLALGTNLGSDSYVSVEEIPRANTCSADMFLYQGSRTVNLTDGGTDYSVATSSDAGAGNRYEETVYALPGTNPCTAVRYFIHYSVFENYPAGTVEPFDRKELLSQFDSMRRTLVLNQ